MTLRSGAPRAKQRWLALLAVVVLSGLLAATAVLAVHDESLFELGGNQAADILGDAAAGPDWADLFTASGGLRDTDGDGEPDLFQTYGGVAASFLDDDHSQKGAIDRTTFSGAGGSNKNGDPIGPDDCASYLPPLTGSACDTWHWDAGNVPPKDDLKNVYAYATINPANDHLIIYAGLERLDPSGDSHIDLEFFGSPVALDEDVPCDDAGRDTTPCEFTGVRLDGDIVVSMDFTQGGGIGSITIHEWNAATSSFDDIGVLGGEGCNVADTICAFNNGGLIDGGPWVNLDSHGDEITQIEKNGFTEFGIDVTALEGSTPCISTFMAKTRSSQSFTAELKDFAGPEGFNICGADIQIGPNDTNEVGQPHTFNVTVNQLIGGQASAPADGTDVDVTLTHSVTGGDIDITANSCDTDAVDPATPGVNGVGTVNGVCSVTFDSDTAGVVTGHAAATLSFGSLSFPVQTDGTGTNSGDATKTFVDAYITITPTETNEVGEDHTFTVTVRKDDGDDGGFVSAPDGTPVSVTLTAANGAVTNLISDTCASPGTSGGTCSVTFDSATAGTITGHASVSLTLNGLLVSRQTNGVSPNSGDAVKTYVDAWITIDPDDTNSIGESHTFTVTARQDDGSSSTTNFVNVPDATDINVSLAHSVAGGGVIVSANSCDTDAVDPATDSNGVGTVSGQCSVTFTSNTPGTVTGNASVSLTLAGLPISRTTDGVGNNSDGAVKTFIAGSLFWEKRYAGELQGGATFVVTRTHDYISGSDPAAFTDITDVPVTVVDDTDGVIGPGVDRDPDPGQFLLTGLVLGRYTVDETVAPDGFAMDPKIETVDVITSTQVEISDDWDNQRPIIKLTEFGYTNAPTGTPTTGVVNGTTTYTAKFKNYGGAAVAFSGTLVITTDPAPGADVQGTVTCDGDDGGQTKSFSDTSLSAGGAETLTVTLTCTYADMQDGRALIATLNGTYTLNNLTRTPSGIPATIRFTVQAD